MIGVVVFIYVLRKFVYRGFWVCGIRFRVKYFLECLENIQNGRQIQDGSRNG